jgi:hypothetical protein
MPAQPSRGFDAGFTVGRGAGKGRRERRFFVRSNAKRRTHSAMDQGRVTDLTPAQRDSRAAEPTGYATS